MPFLISALFLCLSAPFALAETVDLQQALREAVANRPFVQAAQGRAVAAKAAVGEARSRYLPNVSLSEHLFWTDDPAWSMYISLVQEDLKLSQDAGRYNFAPSRRDFETRLSLEQPLYDPDISLNLKRARKGAEAAGYGALWSREEAAFAAFRAYLEVQRASAALAWAESSRREAAETLRIARERQEAGVGLKADALRAGVRVSESDRYALTAANDLHLARRSLALAMGRSEGVVDIAAPLSFELFASAAREEAVARSDLAALATEAGEARLAHRQSRAAYLPRAGLSASYSLHDSAVPFGTDVGSWTVRAQLHWDIFDGQRRSHALARAAALRGAAESRHLEARRQALYQAEEARMRAEEARASLALARLAVSEADEGHRLLLQRYEAGLSGLADLLGVQTALDRARLDAVEAEARYILALGNAGFQGGVFVHTLLANQEDQP
ncbi:TolC family protein [Desulfuromonas sp.]|uniref:TolC family protein n=1 Tax=Desulfuromonas sp. TaxID=892 RepID=UPI0025B7CD8B|nr:TolC family protein [Desulfuromonas sp.]